MYTLIIFAYICCRSAQRWLTSISGTIGSKMMGQRVSQECWASAQRWLTSFSAIIRSDQPGQRSLQECWRSAQRCLISISGSICSDQPGQTGLQQCWRSAQRWLTSISATMRSALSGKGGFELRGVVKPLALFCRHLALLALCHLFSRQTTRKIDIMYTHSTVAFGRALSL